MRALAAIALAVAGCGTVRPVDGTASCPDWRDQIGPALDERCGSCHGGDQPAGGFDVSSYRKAVGDGKSGAVRLGDATSPIVRALDPATADATHAGFADLAPTVRKWVVDCRVDYFRSEFHPPGILDPADSEQFHGQLAREVNFNLDVCAKCHGADFSGGAGPSCKTCHDQGPTGCTTCHGQPPATGSHLAHINPTDARPLDCSDCHVKPAVYTDAGHLLGDDGKVKTRADVKFGALASTGGKAPAFDGAECSNTYCHGASTPTWGGEASCGSCHGVPPSDHASSRCGDCHPKVADVSAHVVGKMLHVDGKVSVGDESGGCTACHGTGMDPAPPRALSGETSPTVVAVGAHQAHLGAPHKLRGPIACTECHLVPKMVKDPGHIDSALPAEVFPVGAGAIARSDGASPSWDHAQAKCGDVYCHGGGAKLGADQAPTVNRTPTWTAPGSIICGSCHGVPPRDGAHDASMKLADCARCHPKTVDQSGAILVDGQGNSSHMNGVIDAQ